MIGIENLTEKPSLILRTQVSWDVAKMGGVASEFDLFTPDLGEAAFLADESAPHPFYTRGLFLNENMNVLELIELAYRNEKRGSLLAG